MPKITLTKSNRISENFPFEDFTKVVISACTATPDSCSIHFVGGNGIQSKQPLVEKEYPNINQNEKFHFSFNPKNVLVNEVEIDFYLS